MMIVIGAWRAFPLLAVCVGVGIVVGVAYIWRAMQKAFFAEPEMVLETHEPLAAISIPEKLGAMILIAASVAVGLYPQMLLRVIVPALNSPLFEGLRKGNWQ
jgi:NADH-quinone oxidoreductase subunit M